MFKRRFEKTTEVPAPQAEVFAWHTRHGAFQRLTPPWDKTEVLLYEGIKDGERVTLRVLAPWPRKWIAEHEDYIPGLQFKDRQIKGPFPKWVHTHRVEPTLDGDMQRCVMRDSIEFKLPMGPLGALAYWMFMRKQIYMMFDHRHATLVADSVDHQKYSRRKKLTVAITGASGMLGKALSAFLSTGGHTVRAVPRRDELTFDLDAIAGADVLVHLAGEPIAQKWNKDVKDRIRRSRIGRTRLLCEQIGRIPEAERPKVMLSASATGVYGNRGGNLLTEDSGEGEGFLAEVAGGWEDATAAASDVGIRVVHLRTGIVLHPGGGALRKMLPVFSKGLGGRLGSGDQYMSWITQDDHVRAMLHAMMDDRLRGPVNLVAPDPVTNQEFTKTLGKVLRKPTVVTAPRAALRFAFGEMADEALLSSQRVEPMRLKSAGFTFRQPKLEQALRELLGRH
ncbi:MAG: TIGR01777 family oxidoreductase [Planctomycetota bacterium]